MLAGPEVLRQSKQAVLVTLLCIGLLLIPSVPAIGASDGDDTQEVEETNSDDELVYLDPNGVIKVLDPNPAEGSQAVAWESPVAQWTHIATGDFNADGDAEIVAVGGPGGNRLAIYDPVAEGLGPGEADGFINGIPWTLLYEETLSGVPLIVATGDFDLNVPVDEIVYYYTLPAGEIVQQDDPYRFVFLAATGSPPSGESWSTLLTYDSGNAWSWIGTGNIDGTGQDEMALIASAIGNLSVYTISSGTLQRILRQSDAVRAWQDGDIGQFSLGGRAELAAGRETVFPDSALFVLRYGSGDWTDVYDAYFDPPPKVVFMGDLTGNGDDELIVLRDVPPDLAGRPRLFVRDNGNDSIGLGEPLLDADNGYGAGVAGDTDGDGREEIAIMRNNRIRIFTEPEVSSAFADAPVTTDGTTILAANLDANGLAGASRFGASPSSIDDIVTSGTESETYAIALSDVVNGRSVPFTYRIENGAVWVDVERSSAQTPATLEVTLDARELATGTFSDRLIVETDDSSIANSPYAIDLTMTVVPGVAVTPGEILSLQDNCESGGDPWDYSIAVSGTSGAGFTLTLPSSAGWASVSPITGTVPATATVSLDGGQLGTGIGETELVARAVLSGEEAVDRVDVRLLCVESTVSLPAVFR